MPSSRLILSSLLTAVLLPPAAFAVDGVILIDQNKAMAGNVTPGDSPGFPITISQPGSYRLDSGLTVPAGTNAIEITASNVTIDLNGFSVVGSGQFGIVSPLVMMQVSGISIRNGLIRGFAIPISLVTGPPPAFLPSLTTLDSLVLDGSIGGSSLDFGDYTRVSNVTAKYVDVNVACPSTIVLTVARSVVRGGGSGTCAFANNATLQ